MINVYKIQIADYFYCMNVFDVHLIGSQHENLCNNVKQFQGTLTRYCITLLCKSSNIFGNGNEDL